MYCFDHDDRHAVAVCQNCGKAVCRSCSRDSGYEIVCSHSCLQERVLWHEMHRRLRQSLGIGAKPPMPPSVPSYFFFGLILLVTGVYFSMDRGELDVLTLAVAAVFFVMSAVSYKRYRAACFTC